MGFFKRAFNKQSSDSKDGTKGSLVLRRPYFFGSSKKYIEIKLWDSFAFMKSHILPNISSRMWKKEIVEASRLID